MTDAEPIACSLGASDFQQRLSEIAEVGAASLIGREEEGGRHILRFRLTRRTATVSRRSSPPRPSAARSSTSPSPNTTAS